MPRQRYTPEPIITKLRQAEVELVRGQTTAEVWRKLGTSEQTYSRWRKEYGGLRVNHLKRLRALELEHRRLRTVSADQALALVVVKATADRAGSWEGKSDPTSLIINGPPRGAGQQRSCNLRWRERLLPAGSGVRLSIARTAGSESRPGGGPSSKVNEPEG